MRSDRDGSGTRLRRKRCPSGPKVEYLAPQEHRGREPRHNFRPVAGFSLAANGPVAASSYATSDACRSKNETPKTGSQRQGAATALPSPISAHGDRVHIAKCRATALFWEACSPLATPRALEPSQSAHSNSVRTASPLRADMIFGKDSSRSPTK
jgi:hypothetical protein